MSMQPSQFKKLIDEHLKAVSNFLTDELSGEEQPRYLHDILLTREFSTDFEWRSQSVSSGVTRADVVPTDSPLPIKRRPSIQETRGAIPKIGLKIPKSESEAIRLLSNQVDPSSHFEDVAIAAMNVKETVEDMLLEGLSTGYIPLRPLDNPDQTYRAKFNYDPKRQYNAATPWGREESTPLTDLRTMRRKCGRPEVVLMSEKTFEDFCNSGEVQKQVGQITGKPGENAFVLPKVAERMIEELLNTTLILIDREIKCDSPKGPTTRRPFEDNVVVFLPSFKAGRLVWSKLPEELKPVAGVSYGKVDEFILISKYSHNDPWIEYSAAQAYVFPVIDNPQDISLLFTAKALEIAPDEVEGDTTITLWEKVYQKEKVIESMKAIGESVSVNISDKKLIERINKLSAAKQDELKELLNE